MLRTFRFALALCALALATLAAQTLARSPAQATGVSVYVPLLTRSPYDLNIASATYLGGSGADEIRATDIAPDGRVLVAGRLEAGYIAPGLGGATDLLGGGEGAVLQLDAEGRPLAQVRLPISARDMEIDQQGRVVLCGSAGLAVISPTLDAALWSHLDRNINRCAVGSDGAVAAIEAVRDSSGSTVDYRLHTFSAEGTPIGSWSVGLTATDLAVDAVNRRLIVSGYTQKTSVLQVAYLKAWDYGGAAAWTSYDFDAGAAQQAGLTGDTRGERVAIGRDGGLYFAGTSDGGTGASIFGRDPKNIAQTLGADRAIATDPYNTPFNVPSVRIIWYGRYSLADGGLIRGQTLLTRSSSGQGNAIAPRAITADEAGRVYIVGDSSCCVQDRSLRLLAGLPVGTYEGGEPYLFVASADLTQRLAWTPLAGPAPSRGGASPANALAVRGGQVSLTATLVQPRPPAAPRSLVTYNAAQAGYGGGSSDGYLLLWPGP